MKDQLKISVIIPVYNVEKFLDKCIESVVNQTFTNLDIILVDDGCSDNSPRICDSWAKKDDRIKVLHKRNEGQSIARNIGLKQATGDYIAFVDSDDYIELNTFEVMLKECLEHNLDVAYYTYDRISLNGTVLSSSDNSEREIFIGEKEVHSFILNLVGRIPSEYSKKGYTTSASMSLYRASIIRSNNILFPNVREIASEDLLFSLQFTIHANAVGCFPYVFYHYLVNENSTTTSFNDAKYHRMTRCLEEVQKFCDTNFNTHQYAPHFLSQILRIYKIAMRYETVSTDSFKTKLRKLSSYCSSGWMNLVYNNSDTKQYPLRDRVFIACMKYKLYPFFFIIYR